MPKIIAYSAAGTITVAASPELISLGRQSFMPAIGLENVDLGYNAVAHVYDQFTPTRGQDEPADADLSRFTITTDLGATVPFDWVCLWETLG